MELTFQVTCTYTSVIEFDMDCGGPQAAGFMPECRYLSSSKNGNNAEGTVGREELAPGNRVNLAHWPYNQRGYGNATSVIAPLTK